MKPLNELYEVIDFNEFGDERGNLVVVEGSGQDIPRSRHGGRIWLSN